MAKKRAAKKPATIIPIPRSRNAKQGALARLAKSAIRSLDEQADRTAEQQREDDHWRYLESCRLAAMMRARGQSYADIAREQGCSASSGFRRVRAWYAELNRHEDFETRQARLTMRIEWSFQQLVAAYATVMGENIPAAEKATFVLQAADRWARFIDLQGRATGVLAPAGNVQMNVGPQAGATLIDAKRIEMPDDPVLVDRIVGGLRDIRALVEGGGEE